MARADLIQTNFTSGEVSPLMRGRVDVQKYMNGAREMMNFVVRPQGGATRRSGTVFIGACKNATYTRIQKFVFSNSQAYILEFGNLYIRFYNGGSIVGGGTPVEVVTPYTTAELDTLYFAQSADQVFIASPNHPPQILSRLADVTWTLTRYIPSDGPYIDVDQTGNKAQISLISDTTSMWSTITGATTYTMTTSTNQFVVGDVNKYVDLTTYGPIPPGNILIESLFQITTYVSATQVKGVYVNNNNIDVYSVAQVGSYGFSYASGHLTTTTPVFSAASVGRIQNVGGSYYLPTAFVSTTNVTATVLPMKVVTSPSLSGLWAVNQVVEFISNGIWLLAQITAVTSSTLATVKVLPQVFIHDSSVNITIPNGVIGAEVNVTSSFSGVFAPTDVGKYIRDTSMSRWAIIDAYTNSSTVVARLIQTFVYTYPATTIGLFNDRVITVQVTFTNNILDPTDVGTIMRFQFASKWRSLTITNVLSPNQCTGTFNDFVPYDLQNASFLYNNGFADNFRMGAWRSVFGYPSIASFHDQRLIFGNTAANPNTMWMSQPGDYYNMSPTDEDGLVTDANAITVTLATGRADPITWLLSSQVLIMGTFGNEFEVIAPSQATGMSPTNIGAFSQSAFGSLSPTVAFRFGVAALFLQRGGNKVREMVYQFQYDSFNSKDITILSEHILRIRGGAKMMDHQVDPVSIFWIVTNNGKLVGMTYDRDQEVVGFHPHDVGGTVESIAVIPNGAHDDVYLVVNRTVNGSTVRYIEMIQTIFDTDTGDTLATMQFMDCSKSYSGASTLTPGGFTHLIGATVGVVSGGKYLGTKTVSGGGTVTLSTAVTSCNVGIVNPAWIRTLDPEGGGKFGTTQGKRKRINKVVVRLKDALPFKHGIEFGKFTPIDPFNFNNTDVPIIGNPLSPPQLFSGDVGFSIDDAYDNGASFYIYQDQPLPMTVISLMPTSNTSDQA